LNLVKHCFSASFQTLLRLIVLSSIFVFTVQGRAGTWADGLFDELSKDFGSVPRGAVLQHGFKIKNNTKDVVGLAGVRSSCGCTSAQLSKRYLQPGEETLLQVRMDSGRFRGLKTITLYVKLDRPEGTEVRIWVKANSRDDVAVNPEVIDFKTVRAGEGGQAKIQVRFFGMPDADIEGVSSASGYLRSNVLETSHTELESIFLIQVDLDKRAPVGKWYSDIWLDTNHQFSAKIRIPVRMEVVSELVASPGIVEFGSIESGKEMERRVVVRGATPFRLIKIEGPDGIQAIFSSDQAKSTHVITFIAKGKAAGLLQGEVRVFTDLAESPVLALPIHGRFLR